MTTRLEIIKNTIEALLIITAILFLLVVNPIMFEYFPHALVFFVHLGDGFLAFDYILSDLFLFSEALLAVPIVMNLPLSQCLGNHIASWMPARKIPFCI